MRAAWTSVANREPSAQNTIAVLVYRRGSPYGLLKPTKALHTGVLLCMEARYVKLMSSRIKCTDILIKPRSHRQTKQIIHPLSTSSVRLDQGGTRTTPCQWHFRRIHDLNSADNTATAPRKTAERSSCSAYIRAYSLPQCARHQLRLFASLWGAYVAIAKRCRPYPYRRNTSALQDP